jgi:hypothetical protein
MENAVRIAERVEKVTETALGGALRATVAAGTFALRRGPHRHWRQDQERLREERRRSR